LTSSSGCREGCDRTRVTSIPNGADLQAVGIRSAVKVRKGNVTTSFCVVWSGTTGVCHVGLPTASA
jgi:hypothetical protein